MHGGVDAAVSWAESGVSPLAVVPEDGRWTAVLPVGEATAARRPYDDVVTMLLNRPVPHRLRPAVGVGVVGRRAVLCVTPGGWRAVRRWLVWQPGHGVVHPGGLPVARLADVVAAAGVDDPGAVGELAGVLHDPAGDARAVMRRPARGARPARRDLPRRHGGRGRRLRRIRGRAVADGGAPVRQGGAR